MPNAVENDGPRQWALATFLFVAALGVYSVGNDRTSFWDRDEARYAGAARTMLRTGDYIVPYFNGTFRFQKPALTYWLVALSYRILGESEFAARLPSGLCMAAACVVVFRLGNRWFGPPAGSLAGWMLALCPVSLLLGKLCIPDGPQLLSAVAAFACLHAIRPGSTGSAETRRRAAFWLWLWLGVAILVKGPIVPGMVAATVLVYCVVSRTNPLTFAWRWPMGLAIFSMVALPWLWAIYVTAGPPFFAEALGRQLGDRVVTAFDGRWSPPGAYAATIMVGFGPWIAFTILALARGGRAMCRSGTHAFLLAWIVGPMLLVECFRSKQAHYLAPAYPALALLAAGYLADVLRGAVGWKWDLHSRAAATIFAALGIGVAGVLGWVAWRYPAGQPWALLGMMIQICAIVAATFLLFCDRLRYALATQGFATFLLGALIGVGLLPAAEPSRIARSVVDEAVARGDAERRPVLWFRTLEPSMIFYSDRALRGIDELAAWRQAVAAAEGATLTVATDDDLPRLRNAWPVYLEVVATRTGMVRLHHATIHLVRTHAATAVTSSPPKAPPIRR